MGEACSAQLPPPSALLNLPPQFMFPISRRVGREGRWWNRSHPAECLCALWVWQMVKKDSTEEQFCGFLPISAGSFSLFLTQEGCVSILSHPLKVFPQPLDIWLYISSPPTAPSAVPIVWHSGQPTSRLCLISGPQLPTKTFLALTDSEIYSTAHPPGCHMGVPSHSTAGLILHLQACTSKFSVSFP